MQKLNRFAFVVAEGRRLKSVKDSRFVGCPFCHVVQKMEDWEVTEWGRKRLNSAAPFCYHAVCPNCGKVSLVFRLSFYLDEQRKIRWYEMAKKRK